MAGWSSQVPGSGGGKIRLPKGSNPSALAPEEPLRETERGEESREEPVSGG